MLLFILTGSQSNTKTKMPDGIYSEKWEWPYNLIKVFQSCILNSERNYLFFKFRRTESLKSQTTTTTNLTSSHPNVIWANKNRSRESRENVIRQHQAPLYRQNWTCEHEENEKVRAHTKSSPVSDFQTSLRYYTSLPVEVSIPWVLAYYFHVTSCF